ncbi:hypothetical protein F2P56_016004 [Juglans regia]|uniref:Uncharacterized protein n=1 Tax=Juglans regia TaxID=51240 RepID=A0A833XFW6_JUGRE|nr:hypothetical protein F2P56_016004 [Juglans regia]
MTSRILRMLGWSWRRRMAMISRIIRGSMAASTVLDLSMIFTATAVSSTIDRAWYTLAKLPRPSNRPNWYFPSKVVVLDDGNGDGVGATPGSMAREAERERDREGKEPKRCTERV